MPRQDLKVLIKKYPKNTALIRYTVGSVSMVWAVGAIQGRDDESTMKERLRQYIPSAKLVEWAIK